MFEYSIILVCIWLLTGFAVSLVNRFSWHANQAKYVIVDGDEFLRKSNETAKDTLLGPISASRKSWEERYYINKTKGRLQ
jgi:hypothetical protein